MMLKFLRGQFTGTVYAQIWENRLKLIHLKSRRVYDQNPWIAVDTRDKKKQIVRAIGNEAYAMRGHPGIDTSNPFSHPRLLVNGFQKAEKVLMHGIMTVCEAKFINPSPIVVIHPREKLEGGLTDIECRLFRELALGAGAHAVHLHLGEELTIDGFSLSNIVEAQID